MPNPTTVLLAEDNDDARDLFAMALRMEGYFVIEARNGREALERMQTIVPALVVTDVAMPELDGVMLAQAIQANESTRNVPVIAITGQREQIDVGAFFCVLAKPCAPEVLLGVVELALSKSTESHTHVIEVRHELDGVERRSPLMDVPRIQAEIERDAARKD